jgi:pimeloyl-ACP methyl ester carboxylesterase
MTPTQHGAPGGGDAPTIHAATGGEPARAGGASRRDFVFATAAAAVPLLAGVTSRAAVAAPAPTIPDRPRSTTMGTVTVGRENSTNIDIYYEDHGAGRPVVLSHGWPLSGTAWEKQVPPLLAAGYRVITYDRRGFGRSSQPAGGYDYGTFADDLHKLVTALDLRDFALVGHSMGSGEVAGYIGKYGTERARKAVFVSALPFFLKSADNPNGVDPSVPAGVMKALAADRPAFITSFLKDFYNADVQLGKRVSPEVIQGNWQTAYGASALGTYACVSAWGTDFARTCRASTCRRSSSTGTPTASCRWRRRRCRCRRRCAARSWWWSRAGRTASRGRTPTR